MRLIWSQFAARQVDEALEALTSIAADDVEAAARRLDELLDRVEASRRFPDAGRVRPELGRDDIRELLVGSYRVTYRRRNAAVEIAPVHHQARRLTDDVLAR